jgi:hypothetical protein
MTTNTILNNTSNAQVDSAAITPHQVATHQVATHQVATHQVTTHQVATHQVDTRSILIHEVVLDTPNTSLEEATTSPPLRAQHQFVMSPNGLVYSGIVWIVQAVPTLTPDDAHAKAA